MPVGDETLVGANAHEESAYASPTDGVIEHADGDSRDAAVDVDGDAHTNEWLVISALRRVAPWTSSEVARDDREPVVIIDDDLAPDTQVGLPTAIRAAST